MTPIEQIEALEQAISFFNYAIERETSSGMTANVEQHTRLRAKFEAKLELVLTGGNNVNSFLASLEFDPKVVALETLYNQIERENGFTQ